MRINYKKLENEKKIFKIIFKMHRIITHAIENILDNNNINKKK